MILNCPCARILSKKLALKLGRIHSIRRSVRCQCGLGSARLWGFFIEGSCMNTNAYGTGYFFSQIQSLGFFFLSSPFLTSFSGVFFQKVAS